MKPCMVSSCAFGRVEERREGQRSSSSTVGNRVSTPGRASGLRAAGRRARASAPASPANDARPRLAMRHPRADAPRALADDPPLRSARASVGGPQGAPFGGAKETSINHRAVVHFERRACAPGHARRRAIRVRRAGRSPVKRRSASGECAPLRECDSAERESIEPRFLFVRCTCQKESSNQIRRSDAEISRVKDRTVPNRLPIRNN